MSNPKSKTPSEETKLEEFKPPKATALFSPPCLLSVFTDSRADLVKTIRPDASGSGVIKDVSGPPTKGTVRVHGISSLAGLARVIDGLESNQALSLGHPDGVDAGDEVNYVTRKVLDARLEGGGSFDKPTIARTKDYVVFGDQCWGLIDVDRCDLSDAALIAALVEADPQWGRCGYVIRPSSSANIFDASGTAVSTGSGGRHIFFLCADAEQLPEYLENLHKQMWLAGHGHILIGASGAMYDRSIVDVAVGSPERIIFAAPPILRGGLTRRHGACAVREGGSVTPAQLSIGAAATKTFNFKVAAAKADASEDSTKKKIAHARARAMTLPVARRRGAVRTMLHDAGRCVLTPPMSLQFAGGGSPVPLADVLANPSEYHGKTLKEPMEPDYNGGSATVARLYLNADGSVVINSMAHGGIVYTTAAKAPEPCGVIDKLYALYGKLLDMSDFALAARGVIDEGSVRAMIGGVSMALEATQKYELVNKYGGLVNAGADFNAIAREVYGRVICDPDDALAWRYVKLLQMTGALPTPKEARSSPAIETALGKFGELGAAIIKTHIRTYNSVSVKKTSVDFFADAARVEIGRGTKEVIMPFVKFTAVVARGQEVPDADLVDAVWADFSTHFPQFEEMLELSAAACFASDCREAYVWHRAPSGFGKSLLFAGGGSVLGGLKMATTVSMGRLMDAVDAASTPIAAAPFIRAGVVVIDEFSAYHPGLKLLTRELTMAAKYGMQETVPCRVKWLMSAEDVPSMGVGGALEVQNIGRFSHIDSTGCGRVDERELFKSIGAAAYILALQIGAAEFYNEAFGEYRAMGRSAAFNAGDAYIHAFHTKHAIAHAAEDLDKGLGDIADEILDAVEATAKDLARSGGYDRRCPPVVEGVPPEFIREVAPRLSVAVAGRDIKQTGGRTRVYISKREVLADAWIAHWCGRIEHGAYKSKRRDLAMLLYRPLREGPAPSKFEAVRPRVNGKQAASRCWLLSFEPAEVPSLTAVPPLKGQKEAKKGGEHGL